MPCPEGIDVPRIFEIYNDALMHSDIQSARDIYANEQHQADNCTECGSCAQRCARELEVTELLEKARKMLA